MEDGVNTLNYWRSPRHFWLSVSAATGAGTVSAGNFSSNSLNPSAGAAIVSKGANFGTEH